MRAVLSEPAEEAIARVMQTLAIAGGQTHELGVGRLSGTRGTLLSAPLHSMALPHITAIAEEFSRRMLVLCSLPLMDLSKGIQQDLWEGALSRAEGAWGPHVAAWKNWHGLKVVEASSYQSLSAFVVARNSIMHGLGQLTRLQTHRDGGRKVIRQLELVGIHVNGIRLVILPGVLRKCADTAKEYISWLDLQTQAIGASRGT
jgi:hypothetical protein